MEPMLQAFNGFLFSQKTEKMSYFWSTAEVEGHKVNLPKTDKSTCICSDMILRPCGLNWLFVPVCVHVPACMGKHTRRAH